MKIKIENGVVKVFDETLYQIALNCNRLEKIKNSPATITIAGVTYKIKPALKKK